MHLVSKRSEKYNSNKIQWNMSTIILKIDFQSHPKLFKKLSRFDSLRSVIFKRNKHWIFLTWWCCQFSSGSSWELDDFASAFWPIWSWCEMSCVQTVISNKNLVRNTKDEADFKRFYTTYHFSCLYKKNVSRKRMLQLNVYFYHRVIGH